MRIKKCLSSNVFKFFGDYYLSTPFSFALRLSFRFSGWTFFVQDPKAINDSLLRFAIRKQYFALLQTILLVASTIVMLPVSAASTAQPDDSAQPVPRQKVGLALAGGGTRGCAHIGVLRVFEREGIPVDCISGTSIGAIVGGLYAAGLSLDDIEGLVCSRKLMHAYETVPIPVRMALIPVFFVPHCFGWHPYDGLYRGTMFANFIRKAAPEGHRNIEEFRIPFAAVAANLLDGKAYGITHGDIGKAVQASSAIPLLRRPVEIGDKLFVDGGVALNLPVDQARELGADFVIAVDIDDDLKVLEKKDFRKIGSVSDRAINMQLSALDQFQLPKADFVIHPDVTGLSLLDGNPKDARRAIKAGEEIAMKLLPTLKQKLQEHSVALAGKVINKEGEKSE